MRGPKGPRPASASDRAEVERDLARVRARCFRSAERRSRLGSGRWAGASLLLWFLVGAAPPPGPSAANKVEAKALFDAAAQKRAEKRWSEVVPLLERSLALYPQFPTAWNLVTALEQLDDRPGADAVLRALIAGDYGPLAEAEVAAVKERLAALARELGTLQVVAEGADAALTIDGRARGTLAADQPAAIRVEAGRRQLQLVTADGRALGRVVEVEAGAERVVRFTFVEAQVLGRLIVEAEAPNTRVWIDGVDRGPAPLDLALAPGRYRVAAAQGEGDREVELGAGQLARVVLPPDEPAPLGGPWIWIGVGVVLVAGAVVTAVLLSGGTEDPLPADFTAPPL